VIHLFAPPINPSSLLQLPILLRHVYYTVYHSSTTPTAAIAAGALSDATTLHQRGSIAVCSYTYTHHRQHARYITTLLSMHNHMGIALLYGGSLTRPSVAWTTPKGMRRSQNKPRLQGGMPLACASVTPPSGGGVTLRVPPPLHPTPGMVMPIAFAIVMPMRTLLATQAAGSSRHATCLCK